MEARLCCSKGYSIDKIKVAQVTNIYKKSLQRALFAKIRLEKACFLCIQTHRKHETAQSPR